MTKLGIYTSASSVDRVGCKKIRLLFLRSRSQNSCTVNSNSPAVHVHVFLTDSRDARRNYRYMLKCCCFVYSTDGPGLYNNEVFIVGSIQRFESSVSISGLQVSLLNKDVVSEVLFCRRAIRIQDILKTMNKVVVSDSVSMRGVDKKIVIVIPSQREQELQDLIEHEMNERKTKEVQAPVEASRPTATPADDPSFNRPIPVNQEDEEVLYQRDGADEFVNIVQPATDKKRKGRKRQSDDVDVNVDDDKGDGGDGGGGDNDDDSDVLEDDGMDIPLSQQPTATCPARKRYTAASHQSLLRRAINSLGKFDKDMILDLFTDAPRHAVLFHFADDDYQCEPW